MANLTKTQLKDLNSILAQLKEVQRFIMRPDIQFCTTSLPHLLSYYNKDGKGLTPMTKEVGSELCYLPTQISRLESFIKENTQRVDKHLENFQCYEINTVQARIYVCGYQCDECKAEEKRIKEGNNDA